MVGVGVAVGVEVARHGSILHLCFHPLLVCTSNCRVAEDNLKTGLAAAQEAKELLKSQAGRIIFFPVYFSSQV